MRCPRRFRVARVRVVTRCSRVEATETVDMERSPGPAVFRSSWCSKQQKRAVQGTGGAIQRNEVAIAASPRHRSVASSRDPRVAPLRLGPPGSRVGSERGSLFGFVFLLGAIAKVGRACGPTRPRGRSGPVVRPMKIAPRDSPRTRQEDMRARFRGVKNSPGVLAAFRPPGGSVSKATNSIWSSPPRLGRHPRCPGPR